MLSCHCHIATVIRHKDNNDRNIQTFDLDFYTPSISWRTCQLLYLDSMGHMWLQFHPWPVSRRACPGPPTSQHNMTHNVDYGNQGQLPISNKCVDCCHWGLYNEWAEGCWCAVTRTEIRRLMALVVVHLSAELIAAWSREAGIAH